MAIIETSYLGPTTYKGGRVVASAHSYQQGRKVRVTLSWDSGLNVSDNHIRAAKALADRLQWAGAWRMDDTGADGGYTFTRSIETVFTVAETED